MITGGPEVDKKFPSYYGNGASGTEGVEQSVLLVLSIVLGKLLSQKGRLRDRGKSSKRTWQLK